MIRVARAAKPAILLRNESKWKTAITAETSDVARQKAQNRYQHKQIKEALVRMFHGKCAYCESAITHIDYGHIEHFKPKALPAYFELAVDWGNLLLACGRCNGSENKGMKFPGTPDGGPLVNPTEEDPAHHLRFDFDAKLKLANVLDVSKRGETTWRTLGLNRPEFVKKLWVIGAWYYQDPEAREIIDLAAESSEEYSAFAREVQSFVLAQRGSAG